MYDPTAPRSRVFLPAILSGLILYACYFPIAAGFLAWVALVPLLSLVRANARPRRIYFAAFVGGLVCYLPAIQWMRVAHPAMYVSWLVLAVYCSLALAASIWLVRRLDRVRVPPWLSVPVVWVSVEYFRSHFPTGFTWLENFGARHPIGFGWYMLGHTQHDWIALIQSADLAGVYGLTFLVAMVNAVVWTAIERSSIIRVRLHLPQTAPSFPAVGALIAAALMVATIIYGYDRLNHEPFERGPRLALIQGNLPQDVKNSRGEEMEQHFLNLVNQALRPPAGEPMPDLSVWPETSYVWPWYEVVPGVNVQSLSRGFQKNYNGSRDIVRDYAFASRTPMLYGLNAYQWEADNREWQYNSALLVNAQGDPVARYDKIHLVPFGEYVPLKETFPFLRVFTPYDRDYGCKPGEQWTRFPLTVGERTYHFACVICYEDTDATLARQYVRPGAAGVDFIVNISNDGWFQGTAEHEQHLAISRFRAVETRRSVVRAVNMGVSAIIDPDGRVVALPGETWAKSKKVEGVVRGPVPIDTRTTLYARLGDWLPVSAWAVVFGGFVLGLCRRKVA
ncbi:MAG TPA: apolipoprotein N-acyltransferase [Gemmataceae bacterium]|nr:apolipoprotein N-acyltransferase [Gemmataceae bacterium]